MNIHEYQAKSIFKEFSVPTPKGVVAKTPKEAEEAAREIGGKDLIIKAQVHAGGRGKGIFKSGFKGGVHLISSPEEAKEIGKKMLGEVLVTHQTGEEGCLVRKVMVAKSVEIAAEYYLAILLDRGNACPVIIASREGGVNIEEVAKTSPDKIMRERVNPLVGLDSYQERKLAAFLCLVGEEGKQFGRLLRALYRLFIERDCSLVEINPLAKTTEGEIVALDAKFNFDDNALYRQESISAFRDLEQENPAEVEAAKYGLNYIGLNGNIACLVNGAGLAMATMDIIEHYGGSPANFLDVGGSASQEQVAKAFEIILSQGGVKAILVNIFGGIMQCDIIASGILSAVEKTKLNLPLIVRLEGTNVDKGKKCIAESGLKVILAENLSEAAKRAVKAAKGE